MAKHSNKVKNKNVVSEVTLRMNAQRFPGLTFIIYLALSVYRVAKS